MTAQMRCGTVVAIANQKGGVGKTTSALSLGAALGKLGKRVLLMDLDPHGCASVHLGVFPEDVTVSAYELLLAEGFDPEAWQAAVFPARAGGMDVVASSVRLAEMDIDLKGRANKGLVLKNLLSEAGRDYDFIILDCPPGMGVLLVNAIVASDLLIIPIQTDFLALHGLRLIFDSIRLLNKVLPKPVAWKALATMYDRRAGACRRVLDLVRAKLGAKLFGTVIDMDTQFREASARGTVIFEVAPQSRGAKQYLDLAREIVAAA